MRAYDTKYQTIIIGGGIAGMTAALQLYKFGIRVLIIEKEDNLGGHLNKWYKLFPGFVNADEVVSNIVSEINDKRIHYITSDEVISIDSIYDNYIVKTSSGHSFEAESVLLAQGFNTFDPTKKEEYGYGLYSNVKTSVEVEKILKEHSNITIPKRVGLIHCVGSRDEKAGNLYCSKLCCVSAVKQSIELKERFPDAEVICFYIDLRMFDNGFEELYMEAQVEHGIKFIRGRLSECSENIDGSLVLKVQDTLTGLPMNVSVDWLVLMVGKEAAKLPKLDKSIDLKLAPNRFVAPENIFYNPNQTSQPGIFCCGTVSGPKTIHESAADAKAAAMSIIDYLNRK